MSGSAPGDGGWTRPCTMPTSERGDLPRAPVRPSVMKRLERNCASASPPQCPSGGESRDERQYRVRCGAVARRLGEREDDERTRLPLPRRIDWATEKHRVVVLDAER